MPLDPDHTRIPDTDDAAEAVLRATFSDLEIASCAVGIYHCQRAEGLDITAAIGNTLDYYIAALRQEKEVKPR